MLRITVHDDDTTCRLALEGRLTGAWVAEMEQCWRKALACGCRKPLVVDLTGLDFVDAAGKYLLMLVHERGAKFIATTLTMQGLVAEITGGSEPKRSAAERKEETAI